MESQIINPGQYDRLSATEIAMSAPAATAAARGRLGPLFSPTFT